MALVAASLFLMHCAAGTVATATRPEELPSHVYPLPLDNVLAEATTALEHKGWHVQRSGDVLFTDWRHGQIQTTQQLQTSSSVIGSLIAYRVYGERVDAGYCTLRVERLVATQSTLDFGQKRGGHVVEQTTASPSRSPTPVHNEQRTLLPAFGTEPEFEDNFEGERNTGVPAGMVVSGRDRDTKLEFELQEKIDPYVAASTPAAAPATVAAALEGVADAGASSPPQPTGDAMPSGDGVVQPRANPTAPKASSRPTALAGIWAGTFTFRGKITGSFSGEVTVTVDGDSVELSDFCPENGGTLTAQGSGVSASWQGSLACPPIPLRGCPSAVFTYKFVNANLNDSTLTVVAAGSVETGGRCLDSGGEMGVGGDLTVAFVAQKADYVHIAVTRAKRETVCVWPKDWEDFSSNGSMSMPDNRLDDSGYLGIIRARGSRLGEIQRLLRHCRQVVLLHGQPVLMRLAVTRSHP